ncbi:hypothetical protein Scep_022263 [Stephania cephalantha]|uniref:Uncharacterized protein n=1 Tax=Stephania cephalantha TaxID=152367 RepID=A0AAP0I2J0_9MAGN
MRRLAAAEEPGASSSGGKGGSGGGGASSGERMRRAGASDARADGVGVRVAGGVAEGERRRRERAAAFTRAASAPERESTHGERPAVSRRRRLCMSRDDTTTMTVDDDGDGGGEDCAAAVKGFDRVVWAEKGGGGWVFSVLAFFMLRQINDISYMSLIVCRRSAIDLISSSISVTDLSRLIF